MVNQIANFINQNSHLLLQTLKELCAIPAPSHYEDERAYYCKNWLENIGAKGVYIDQAKNVVFPYRCNDNNITAVAAHTDTVFPDIQPVPLTEDDKNLYCAGVGDNTASVAVLLLTAKFFVENNVQTQNGVLFVFNSCEEGLGNLKGTKQIFNCYRDKIDRFISFDTNLDKIANRCVGSCRYKVQINSKGGHSFLDFGNENAIVEMSKLVSKIYEIKVPKINNSNTSYNVGLIDGGTSVNTIPQSAEILCEYRSDNVDCFAEMGNIFQNIFQHFKNKGVDISVEIIGERPCMKNDIIVKTDILAEQCKSIVKKVTKIQPEYISSSTDCNIPLSLGIPAVCVGVFRGGGMHKREEWVEKSSLPVGLELGITLLLNLTGVII